VESAREGDEGGLDVGVGALEGIEAGEGVVVFSVSVGGEVGEEEGVHGANERGKLGKTQR
jgi:hypothetical protein